MKRILCHMLSFIMAFSAVGTSAPVFSTAFSDDLIGVTDMSDECFVMGEYDGISLNFSDFPKILADSDCYLLGDYLDANNKAVYDELAKLVTPSLDKITITLPEPVQFTTTKLTSTDQNLINAVFGTCSSAVHAVLFDKPEIFWFNQNEMSVSPNNLTYKYDIKTKIYTYTIRTITITPVAYSGFSDIDDIMNYKNQLEKAVEDFEVKGNTNSEKLKCIHDKIAEFTYYDETGVFSGSALSSLVTTASVCEGYSKGFKMICDRIGIPCICVFGNYNAEEKVAHMWNYVLMEDNYWYAVDVTWDDKDGKDGVEVVSKYFLKGSDDFNTNHSPCEEYFTVCLKYPEIASWNYGENPDVKYEYGDLNHDGKVSIADLVYCASYVLAINTEDYRYSCDVNNDGRVDVYDVIVMRKLISELRPAE
ncbi:MAG: hypothetical protein K2K91_05915 [Ruminococcus sp.]|nr:hypothetical protein [Ruminococcus sp.]MDE7099322.1 hypothetical protein [Ruminococcus sp.]